MTFRRCHIRSVILIYHVFVLKNHVSFFIHVHIMFFKIIFVCRKRAYIHYSTKKVTITSHDVLHTGGALKYLITVYFDLLANYTS
jgi:hypothetical protein